MGRMRLVKMKLINITPGMIFRTPLANDDLADKNWLAVLNFDAKPLGGGFAP